MGKALPKTSDQSEEVRAQTHTLINKQKMLDPLASIAAVAPENTKLL